MTLGSPLVAGLATRWGGPGLASNAPMGLLESYRGIVVEALFDPKVRPPAVGTDTAADFSPNLLFGPCGRMIVKFVLRYRRCALGGGLAVAISYIPNP
ncbi:hypothetical protein ACVW0W_006001 [Bradyrhizobium sp. USDA 4469]